MNAVDTITMTTAAAERSFEQLEAVIALGLATFIEVGEALLEVRDRRLYRDTHATFEAYCRDRWQFSRQRAAQLITASSAVLEMSTIVDTLPANEAQARELAKIADGVERVAVWRRACETQGGKPTAKVISDALHLQRAAGKLSLAAAKLSLDEKIRFGTCGADALAAWGTKAAQEAAKLYGVWDMGDAWFAWIETEYGLSHADVCVSLALATLPKDEITLHFTLALARPVVMTTGSVLREAAAWRQPKPAALFYEEAAEMAEQHDAERNAEIDAIPGIEAMGYDEIYAAISSRERHRQAAGGD